MPAAGLAKFMHDTATSLEESVRVLVRQVDHVPTREEMDLSLFSLAFFGQVPSALTKALSVTLAGGIEAKQAGFVVKENLDVLQELKQLLTAAKERTRVAAVPDDDKRSALGIIDAALAECDTAAATCQALVAALDTRRPRPDPQTIRAALGQASERYSRGDEILRRLQAGGDL